MLRNRILAAYAALFLSFAPMQLTAGGLIDTCPPVGQDVVMLLQRYAATDPANYCIRAMTLAQTNCRPQEVVQIANAIGQPRRLPPVVPGCQPPVLMSAVPAYYPPPVLATTARETVSHASGFSGWWLLGLLPLIGLAFIGHHGGDHDTTTTATNIDDEFNAQYTLAIVGAKDAYKRGFTGKGVKIGLIDTGVDTSDPEFAGRIGFTQDFTTGSATLNPHGTEVAGVMAANRNFHGMHGLAYEATIDSYRVFDENGVSIANYAAAINAAVAQGDKIINGSYGPSNVAGFETLGHQVVFSRDIADATAYLNAVAHDTILVFPAGNEYQNAPTVGLNPTGPGFLPFIRPSNSNLTSAATGAYRDLAGNVVTNDFSALQPNTIVVVGTDRTGTILGYSNRCGVAKDWCMAAPAEHIFTTGLNDTYVTVDGTSFAAPQVSAAAAVLKQEFPSLTAPQIVQLLLTTATDLGAPGVDAVYGHGMLNLSRASAPVGTTGIATKGYVDGARASLQDTALTFSSAFGVAASDELGGKEIAFLDSYDRAYSTSLSGIVHVDTSNFNTDQAVFGYGKSEDREELQIGDRLSVSFTSEGSSDSRLTGDKPQDPNAQGMDVRSFTASSSLTDATSASVHYKDAEALTVGFTEQDRARLNNGIAKNNLRNPYAAFAGNGYASIIETEALGGKVRVAGFFGHEGDDTNSRVFGSQAELGYDVGHEGKAFLSFGMISEDGYVLGSKGSGAFAFGSGTMTMYAGMGGQYKLDGSTTLRATAYAGWTNPSLSDNSLITNMSTLMTTAFNASIERKNVAQENDSLTFGIAQPLRVEGGSMQVNLPYARDAQNNTVYQTSLTQALGGTGREIDLEANYALPLSEDTTFSAGGLYRHDAGHQAGKQDVLGVLRVTKKF